MKLVIPMAGKGTRLRPHSHTVPKPLLPLAGKPLLERIVETFEQSLDRSFEEIVFILGDSSADIRSELSDLAERHGALASFAYQDRALGTAHALLCAADKLEGELVIVFADTLFQSSQTIEITDCDCTVWLKEVDDPSRFGVALTEGDRIVGFVEKPAEPISDKAIIGVYYFKEGSELRRQMQYLLDNVLTGAKGEYHITDAMDRMVKEGKVFLTATVDTWLDCGTLEAWLATDAYLLGQENVTNESGRFRGTTIIEPVHIGRNVVIIDSTIGPRVSIADGCRITNSVLKDAILMEDASLSNCELYKSTIGERAQVVGLNGTVNLGDDSIVQAQ